MIKNFLNDQNLQTTYNNSCLTAFFPGKPGQDGNIRINHSGFFEAEVMGWQWHQLYHMQVICTSLQTNNHASTSSLKFLTAGCSSCRPTNSIKALKAQSINKSTTEITCTLEISNISVVTILTGYQQSKTLFDNYPESLPRVRRSL